MRENEGRALIRDFSFRSLHANWHFFSTGRSRLRFVSTFGIHMAYYLTDDIYPKWTTFIQSIRLPQGPKNSLFAKTQEAVRKDVERAFGVLQARLFVVKTCFWNSRKRRWGFIFRQYHAFESRTSLGWNSNLYPELLLVETQICRAVSTVCWTS